MNTQKATKFLAQIHKLDTELEALLAEADLMQKLAADCDGANAKSAAVTIRRYSAKINAKVNQYIGAREKVGSVIENVADDDCRLLLVKRYLHGETWEKIAEEMNFSAAHIFRLRQKALALVEKAIQ